MDELPAAERARLKARHDATYPVLGGRNILRKLNAANRTHAAFVVNRLLGQDAQPTVLPTSSRPFDRAHRPNLATRGMTDATCGRAATPSVCDQSAAD